MTEDRELKCPHCGADILDTDTECMSCGAEICAGPPVGQSQAGEAVVQTDDGEVEVVTPDTDYLTIPEAQRVDWADIAAGGGFLDSLSRSWRFFGACLRMLTAYPAMMVPPLLGVLVSFGTVGLAYGVLKLTGLWEVAVSSGEHEMPLMVYVVLVPLFLLGYLCMLSVMGMVAHMVDVHLRGRRATLGQALADVIRNFPALFYLATVNTAVSLLLSLLRSKTRSWGGRALTGVAERARDAANSLLVPVIMLEDKSLKEATTRAYSLFRRRVLDIVIAEMGLLVLGRVLAFLVAIFAVGLFVAASVSAQVMLPLAIAGVILVVTLVSAFTGFVRTAYYTCLYLWALAMESAQSEAVPAPEPLAKALAA